MLFCLTLIFSFTSCGNLNLPKKPSETGSFSFVLSDDILAHLEDAIGSSDSTAIARSAITPLITATVSLDKASGRQLVDPVTVSGTLEELNGRVIEIKNVPLNTPFIVSMVIKVDNKEILTGTSDTITLTSTAPTDVTISLKLSDSLSSAEKEEAALWGTWTFDYGYNQDLWADDLITFNIDGTFDTHHINQDYAGWNKGTYSIGYDNLHNMILTLNITKYSDDWCSTWHDINITNYYYLDYDSDELSLSRIKRDQSATDGPIEYFDPPIYNHYYRVKNGNREQLENATWNAVKSNDYWEEHTCTWAFNTDGTMVNTFDGSPSDAIWEIIQEDDRTLLYVKVTWNPDYQEWWYDYTSLGPDLLHVKAVKHTTNGIEDENDADSYYYRDIPLVKYTYHIIVNGQDRPFTDYCPKGEAYTLLDTSKALYIGIQEDVLNNIEFLGCYDNQNLTGSSVTAISASNNTTDREFWVKTGLKCKKNAWWSTEEKREDWNYETLLPADLVVRNLSRTQGNTRFIRVSGTLSDDIQTWGSVGIYADADNYWHEFASDWIPIHSENKKFYQIFEIPWDDPIPDDAYLRFRFTYSSDVGKPVIIEDYDIFMFDDSLSYKVEYNFGKMKLKPVTYCREDTLTLPTYMPDFEWADWDIAYSLNFTGWYENENYTKSITQIAANSVSARSTTDVYAKYIPKLSRYDHPGSVDDPYGWHTAFRAAAFTSELGNRLNTHQLVKVKITATVAGGINLENGFNFYLGICEGTSDAVPLAGVGWSFTVDGNKLTAEPEFTLEEEKTVPGNDNKLFLLLSYGKDTYDGEIQFTDFKFELVTD